MKKYLEKVYQKPPHERRNHALQIATGVTAFALLVWVTTLGLRFALPAEDSSSQDTTQVASVANAQDGSNATLLVATSSDATYINQ